MEEPHGTVFVSIPSLLDASVAPDGCHVMHVFTPDWVDNWTVIRGSFCCLCRHAAPLWQTPGTQTRRCLHTLRHSTAAGDPSRFCCSVQNRGSKGYEEKKRQVVDGIIARLESYFPGLEDAIVFRRRLIAHSGKEPGAQRTHRRFMGRTD